MMSLSLEAHIPRLRLRKCGARRGGDWSESRATCLLLQLCRSTVPRLRKAWWDADPIATVVMQVSFRKGFAMKINVAATDGTVLGVNVHGEDAPELTIVFVHGFCMNSASWARIRRGVADRLPALQVVTYDHRGHGTSEDGPSGSHTVGTLGDDLAAVVEATAAESPVVLVGHSLGAMTILACLRQHPAIASQVRGMQLVATASGKLACYGGIARFLPASLGRALPAIAHRLPHLFESVWSMVRTAMSPRLGSCGKRRRPSALVLAELLASLLDLDESEGLSRLAEIPTTVVAGARDCITPVPHAKAIAAAIPGARLRVIGDAGHNLLLTHPEVVGQELLRLSAASKAHSLDMSPLGQATALG